MLDQFWVRVNGSEFLMGILAAGFLGYLLLLIFPKVILWARIVLLNLYYWPIKIHLEPHLNTTFTKEQLSLLLGENKLFLYELQFDTDRMNRLRCIEKDHFTLLELTVHICEVNAPEWFGRNHFVVHFREVAARVKLNDSRNNSSFTVRDLHDFLQHSWIPRMLGLNPDTPYFDGCSILLPDLKLENVQLTVSDHI